LGGAKGKKRNGGGPRNFSARGKRREKEGGDLTNLKTRRCDRKIFDHREVYVNWEKRIRKERPSAENQKNMRQSESIQDRSRVRRAFRNTRERAPYKKKTFGGFGKIGEVEKTKIARNSIIGG